VHQARLHENPRAEYNETTAGDFTEHGAIANNPLPSRHEPFRERRQRLLQAVSPVSTPTLSADNIE
jgi:hypothetical protein